MLWKTIGTGAGFVIGGVIGGAVAFFLGIPVGLLAGAVGVVGGIGGYFLGSYIATGNQQNQLHSEECINKMEQELKQNFDKNQSIDHKKEYEKKNSEALNKQLQNLMENKSLLSSTIENNTQPVKSSIEEITSQLNGNSQNSNQAFPVNKSETRISYDKKISDLEKDFETKVKEIDNEYKKLKEELANHTKNQDQINARIEALEQNYAESFLPLLAEHCKLMEEYYKKEVYQEKQQQINVFSKLKSFYHLVRDKLETAFFAIKVLSSGFLEIPVEAKVKRGQTVLNIIGNVVNLPGISTVLNIASSAMGIIDQKIVEKKIQKLSKFIGIFGTATDIAEEGAMELTNHYEEQLNELASNADTERLAKGAVARIIQYMNDCYDNLPDGSNNDSQHRKIAKELLISAVLKVKIKEDLLSLDDKNIKTHDKEKKWTEEDIFTKPGIKISDKNNSETFYSGRIKIKILPTDSTRWIDLKPEEYKYRLGTEAEVKENIKTLIKDPPPKSIQSRDSLFDSSIEAESDNPETPFLPETPADKSSAATKSQKSKSPRRKKSDALADDYDQKMIIGRKEFNKLRTDIKDEVKAEVEAEIKKMFPEFKSDGNKQGKKKEQHTEFELNDLQFPNQKSFSSDSDSEQPGLNENSNTLPNAHSLPRINDNDSHINMPDSSNTMPTNATLGH